MATKNLGKVVPQKGTDYFTEEDIETLNIPKNTSDLNNDSDFVTKDELNNIEETISNELEKVVTACCDKKLISSGNYNLLKLSKCSYSSGLQDAAEGIISSTNTNVVTGWFPVIYGKYYSVTTLYNGKRVSSKWFPVHVQLKLKDGTIKFYGVKEYPYASSTYRTLGVDDENAIAMRVQFQLFDANDTSADISDPDKIKVYEPMIIEGDTEEEARNNGITFKYLDGDEEIFDKMEYTLKVDKLKRPISQLYEVQRYIADDWRLPFIDVFHKLGLGSNHIIPNSYNIWGGTGYDLTQKSVMMSDGVHPFKGNGVTMMYAQSIIPQLKVVPPLYSEDSENDDWTNKTMLWMGTSIPAGSDPVLNIEEISTTYPDITANKLGATCVNVAKGSSCVRINASTGDYSGFMYYHLIRALSRTTAEADIIQQNWDTIKTNVVGAESTISDSDLEIMKNHSFETLLLPYLNGTKTMPDLFVIDHGHNDTRPLGIDGEQDLWVEPTVENIKNGILAEDTYMTDNNYENLKAVLNNDLSKISDVESFVASLNRNCLIGAINFIITLIYSYNPRARIVIVSNYN